MTSNLHLAKKQKEMLGHAPDNHPRTPSCPTYICLGDAVMNNDVGLVSQLLQCGQANAKLEITVEGGLKVPPVYYATLNGQVKMVRALCKHGADVDQKRNPHGWGHTPLTIAVHRSNLEMVTALCEQGANVNATWCGLTALMLACKVGIYLVVEELLKCNPNLNVRNSLGNTALHIGCLPHLITCWADPKMLELLLAQPNLEYDVKNAKGQTPFDLVFSSHQGLYLSGLSNKLRVVTLFVHAGFSVNQKLLANLLSAMAVFMDAIIPDVYVPSVHSEVDEVVGGFCAAIEMYFASGCWAGEREHGVMTSMCLSPTLKSSGIQDYAFGACSNRTPGSLKRLSKLRVRHHMGKQLGQNVQGSGLPALLSTYILLDRNDLDWTEPTQRQ